MKKKIAIYPGTFNPFTIGHLNILEKAEKLFGKDNVIIAVGENPSKDKNPQEMAYYRTQTIRGNLPSRNVESYKGFLTDYIWKKEEEGFDVTVIRGLRNGFDLQYETNLLRALQDFKPDIQVLFYLCDKQFDHVSSSLYRLCEADKPFSGHMYIAKETVSAKIVSSSICAVIVKSGEEDIMEKYAIITKEKSIGFNPDFIGTYVECLSWIKEQELKND
jgi:pantetheine-phosphate adenylyltransferase